ncbi:MAG: NADH-quinone oxidoreductase subunit L, partial [Actinobacteria bacterium]|nr:NADH-quinone oxidoreductase subunit L [Actinomycetota bacterium]
PLYLTGLAGAILAAAYAGKAVGIALRPVRTDAPTAWDTEQRGTRTVSLLEKAPLLILAAAAAVLGVLELPPVARRIADALGEHSPISARWGELAVSSVLAVAAVLAAAWAGNRIPSPAWATSWLGTTAVPRMVTMPLLTAARALARVDDHGIDRAVTAAATWTRSAATLAARVDDHGIDAAVGALARGTRRLGVWAVRPQTGQVHQYYAQAAVLLAAAVALLAIVR